jgi:hypothetical protein
MLENRRSRFIVFLFLVGAIVAATLAVPIWIEQITGKSEPKTPVDLPFNTPTQTLLETAAPNTITKPTSPPTLSPTPGEVSADNCTFDVSYWIEHQETWPFDVIRIADKTYGKEESYLIIASDSEEVSQILLKQIITYMLNIYRGTDPVAIKQTVVESLDWLQAHPISSELSELDRKNGLDLALGVQAFNQGVVGPGTCPEPIFTATLPPSLTPAHTTTPIETTTFTPTITPTITATSTPEVTLPSEYLTPVPPVRPKPDKTKPPPTAEPPEPQPTTAPTEEPPPPPEPTQPPPPTAAPTKVQPPTPAPTPAP